MPPVKRRQKPRPTRPPPTTQPTFTNDETTESTFIPPEITTISRPPFVVHTSNQGSRNPVSQHSPTNHEIEEQLKNFGGVSHSKPFNSQPMKHRTTINRIDQISTVTALPGHGHPNNDIPISINTRRRKISSSSSLDPNTKEHTINSNAVSHNSNSQVNFPTSIGTSVSTISNSLFTRFPPNENTVPATTSPFRIGLRPENKFHRLNSNQFIRDALRRANDDRVNNRIISHFNNNVTPSLQITSHNNLFQPNRHILNIPLRSVQTVEISTLKPNINTNRVTDRTSYSITNRGLSNVRHRFPAPNFDHPSRHRNPTNNINSIVVHNVKPDLTNDNAKVDSNRLPTISSNDRRHNFHHSFTIDHDDDDDDINEIPDFEQKIVLGSFSMNSFDDESRFTPESSNKNRRNRFDALGRPLTDSRRPTSNKNTNFDNLGHRIPHRGNATFLPMSNTNSFQTQSANDRFKPNRNFHNAFQPTTFRPIGIITGTTTVYSEPGFNFGGSSVSFSTNDHHGSHYKPLQNPATNDIYKPISNIIPSFGHTQTNNHLSGATIDSATKQEDTTEQNPFKTHTNHHFSASSGTFNGVDRNPYRGGQSDITQKCDI